MIRRSIATILAILTATAFGVSAADVNSIVAKIASSDPGEQQTARIALQDAVAEATANGLGTPQAQAIENALLVHAGDQTPLQIRRWVLRQLALCGTEKAVPVLAGNLGDKEPEVRDLCRKALGHIGSTLGIELMKSAMAQDKRPDDRIGYIQALGAAGEPARSAVPALAEFLSSPNQDIALAAVDSLTKIGGPDAFKAMMQVYKGASDDLKQAIQSAVVSSGMEAVAASKLARTGANSAIRNAAFRQLLGKDPATALAILKEAIADPKFAGRNLLVRTVLMDKSAMTDSGELAPAVATLLPTLPEDLQIAALGAIGDRGLKPAEPYVLNVAQKAKSPALRLAALDALIKIAGADSFPFLKSVFQGDDREARDLAARAIAAIDAPAIDKELVQATSTGDSAQRIAAIGLLGLRNAKNTAAHFNEIAKIEKDDAVAQVVFSQLEKVGDLESAKALAAVVARSQGSPIQRKATTSLKRLSANLGDPEALWKKVYAPAFTSASSDKVTAELANALDSVPCEASLAKVRELLKAEGDLRAAGISALRRWPDFKAGEVWVDVVLGEGFSESDKKAAADAIQRILTSRNISGGAAQKVHLAAKFFGASKDVEARKKILALYAKPARDQKQALKQAFKAYVNDPDLGAEVKAMLGRK